MTIASVSSISLANQTSAVGQSTFRQARQDFEQIFQSVQTGNLSSAQQAYNDLQQLRSNATPTTTPATGSTAAAASNSIVSDWNALGQALGSGSLSSAQDALTKLKQDAVAQWQAQIQNAQAAYALISGSFTTSAATTAPNAVQTDLTNLQASLQAGDTAGAQKLLAQLQQDLQSSAQGAQFAPHHHHHHHRGIANETAAAPTVAAAPTPTTASSGTSSSSSA